MDWFYNNPLSYNAFFYQASSYGKEVKVWSYIHDDEQSVFRGFR